VNRLREVRVAKGMSQVELARRVHAHPSLLSRAENSGGYVYPKLRRAIARTLGVQIDEVFPTEAAPDPVTAAR